MVIDRSLLQYNTPCDGLVNLYASKRFRKRVRSGAALQRTHATSVLSDSVLVQTK